jgi:general secretion pathway protein K
MTLPVRAASQERGVALLIVLLLVAVVGAIAAASLSKLRASTISASSGVAVDQGRAFAIGLEALALFGIDDLQAAYGNSIPPPGYLLGVERDYPMPGGGTATATLSDGGSCFNINSLVQGGGDVLSTNPQGVVQFTALMQLIGIDRNQAARVAAAAADWADSDLDANPAGAEDADYSGAGRGYRPGNTRFADVTELRAVAGVTPEAYRLMRPLICALPATDMSRMNLNMMEPWQAPLLAMLAPEQINVDLARRILSERPQAGWQTLDEFWGMPLLKEMIIPYDVKLQPQLRTAWYAAQFNIRIGDSELTDNILIDARARPSKLVVRRWGNEE